MAEVADIQPILNRRDKDTVLETISYSSSEFGNYAALQEEERNDERGCINDVTFEVKYGGHAVFEEEDCGGSSSRDSRGECCTSIAGSEISRSTVEFLHVIEEASVESGMEEGANETEHKVSSGPTHDTQVDLKSCPTTETETDSASEQSSIKHHDLFGKPIPHSLDDLDQKLRVLEHQWSLTNLFVDFDKGASSGEPLTQTQGESLCAGFLVDRKTEVSNPEDHSTVIKRISSNEDLLCQLHSRQAERDDGPGATNAVIPLDVSEGGSADDDEDSFDDALSSICSEGDSLDSYHKQGPGENRRSSFRIVVFLLLGAVSAGSTYVFACQHNNDFILHRSSFMPLSVLHAAPGHSLPTLTPTVVEVRNLTVLTPFVIPPQPLVLRPTRNGTIVVLEVRIRVVLDAADESSSPVILDKVVWGQVVDSSERNETNRERGCERLDNISVHQWCHGCGCGTSNILTMDGLEKEENVGESNDPDSVNCDNAETNGVEDCQPDAAEDLASLHENECVSCVAAERQFLEAAEGEASLSEVEDVSDTETMSSEIDDSTAVPNDEDVDMANPESRWTLDGEIHDSSTSEEKATTPVHAETESPSDVFLTNELFDSVDVKASSSDDVVASDTEPLLPEDSALIAAERSQLPDFELGDKDQNQVHEQASIEREGEELSEGSGLKPDFELGDKNQNLVHEQASIEREGEELSEGSGLEPSSSPVEQPTDSKTEKREYWGEGDGSQTNDELSRELTSPILSEGGMSTEGSVSDEIEGIDDAVSDVEHSYHQVSGEVILEGEEQKVEPSSSSPSLAESRKLVKRITWTLNAEELLCDLIEIYQAKFGEDVNSQPLNYPSFLGDVGPPLFVVSLWRGVGTALTIAGENPIVVLHNLQRVLETIPPRQ